MDILDNDVETIICVDLYAILRMRMCYFSFLISIFDSSFAKKKMKRKEINNQQETSSPFSGEETNIQRRAID